MNIYELERIERFAQIRRDEHKREAFQMWAIILLVAAAIAWACCFAPNSGGGWDEPGAIVLIR